MKWAGCSFKLYTLEKQKIFVCVCVWTLHPGACMQIAMHIQCWHVFTLSGTFLVLEANCVSCLCLYYTVSGCEHSLDLRYCPCGPQHGSSYFLYLPKSKCLQRHEDCLPALTVWSWVLVCYALFCIAEILESASLRHKPMHCVEEREPNLEEPCPCHLLEFVTDAFCLSHGGLKSSSWRVLRQICTGQPRIPTVKQDG